LEGVQYEEETITSLYVAYSLAVLHFHRKAQITWMNGKKFFRTHLMVKKSAMKD